MSSILVALGPSWDASGVAQLLQLAADAHLDAAEVSAVAGRAAQLARSWGTCSPVDSIAVNLAHANLIHERLAAARQVPA